MSVNSSPDQTETNIIPAPEREAKKPVCFYRLQFQNEEIESKPQAQIAKACLSAINIVKLWTSSQKPLSENMESSGVLEKIEKEAWERIFLLDEVTKLSAAFKDDSSKVSEDSINDVLEKVRKKEFGEFLKCDLESQNIDLVIDSEEKFNNLVSASGISSLTHDLKNFLQKITGAPQSILKNPERMQERYEFWRPKINRTIDVDIEEKIKSDLDRFTGEAKPTIEDVPVKELKGMFEEIDLFLKSQKGLEGINFSLSIQETLLDMTVPWSEIQAKSLLGNITSNLIKVRPKNVKAEIGIQDGKLAITIDDDGPGFPPGIVNPKSEGGANGDFEKAPKGLGYASNPLAPTTGTGMAAEAERVRELVRGQIIASNLIDSQGKLIGARTTILLLLAQQPLESKDFQHDRQESKELVAA